MASLDLLLTGSFRQFTHSGHRNEKNVATFIYVFAMQHSKRHNSEILRLHPGMGGRLGNRLVWIIPSWVALYFYAAYWSTLTFIRLFMYNFNCLSFIIWEGLEKYVNITSKIFLFFIPYGYKYETLQNI